jgi:hypothetical protein
MAALSLSLSFYPKQLVVAPRRWHQMSLELVAAYAEGISIIIIKNE